MVLAPASLIHAPLHLSLGLERWPQVDIKEDSFSFTSGDFELKFDFFGQVHSPLKSTWWIALGGFCLEKGNLFAFLKKMAFPKRSRVSNNGEGRG